MNKGAVYLVGAGPGNPGLLTLRAKELLEQADALVYDYLVHPALMHWAPARCELIFVGKKAGHHAKSQEEIHEILVAKARQGKRVVRLKGGDPYLFGRGSEEGQALARAGVEFEVVPGVTAASGAAAYSGSPLTTRATNSTLVIVTGHEDPDKPETTVDWEGLPKENATLCIYMGVGQLPRIAERLLKAGFDPATPVACVEWATLGHQRVCRGGLGSIAEKAAAFALRPPSIIIIGESVAMNEDLSWFEKKPLQGRRIVVTRSQGQASELSAMLEKLGAEVIGLPLISIAPNVDPQTAADVFAEIGSYDWIVFSSPNGVRHFFAAFFEAFPDIRSLGFIRIAAVGKSTAAELRQLHLTAELVPPEANADSLADALVATGSLDSAKVLVVAGNLGRDTLVDKIEEARAIVDRFEVYKTEPTDLSDHPAAKSFRERGADAILFTSSSGARSFVDQAKHLVIAEGGLRPKSISIGKITSATMKELGLPVDVQAKESSLEGLVEATLKRFGSRG